MYGAVHQRAAGRPGDRRTAATRSCWPPSSATSAARTGSSAASTAARTTSGRPATPVLRRLGRRPHRPLLPAPGRPEHADRGDRRRDGRAGRRRQGPIPRAVRGLGRRPSAAPTPCTRSPRCRASTRCGPGTSRPRSCRRCASWASASSPYSPLGRGFLTGTITLHRRPRRRTTSAGTTRGSPDDALPANLAIVDAVRALADEKGATPGQVALAWVLRPGRRRRPDPGHQAGQVPRGECRRRRLS